MSTSTPDSSDESDAAGRAVAADAARRRRRDGGECDGECGSDRPSGHPDRIGISILGRIGRKEDLGYAEVLRF